MRTARFAYRPMPLPMPQKKGQNSVICLQHIRILDTTWLCMKPTAPASTADSALIPSCPRQTPTAPTPYELTTRDQNSGDMAAANATPNPSPYLHWLNGPGDEQDQNAQLLQQAQLHQHYMDLGKCDERCPLYDGGVAASFARGAPAPSERAPTSLPSSPRATMTPTLPPLSQSMPVSPALSGQPVALRDDDQEVLAESEVYLQRARAGAKASKLRLRGALKVELEKWHNVLTVSERGKLRSRREAAVSRQNKVQYANELEAIVCELVRDNRRLRAVAAGAAADLSPASTFTQSAFSP
jgi:hypothetical protein